MWAGGGYYNAQGVTSNLLEHWDGTEWSVVPSPSPGVTQNILQGLSSNGPTDAWAVGYMSSDPFAVPSTMALHWNGSRWSTTRSVNVGQESIFAAVAVDHASGVWAVGEHGPGVKPLIEHDC